MVGAGAVEPAVPEHDAAGGQDGPLEFVDRFAGDAVGLRSEALREDLSADIGTAPRPGGTLKAALQRAESEILVSMLEKHEGRQARAAAELGITRQALWAKLRRLGVWPSEPV